ncbi:hypothetical protein FIBSPDRAFT_879240 [Athelia psychrophila]|uniref:Uncharacterized protein n=1 Tax=Athelia psychrophila TaxID=1759441 RepID=A0A167U849_9AGAM|nr:hypothetical protein FIBSPDRAFT_879240 [Fibularhizoctonia sp. CBS 109695]
MLLVPAWQYRGDLNLGGEKDSAWVVTMHDLFEIEVRWESIMGGQGTPKEYPWYTSPVIAPTLIWQV